MKIRPRHSSSLLLAVLIASAVVGQDSVDRDYRDELPRLAPREVDEALGLFELADPQLRLEPVTSEPGVKDPVAITFDEQGRAYVAQMRGYSERQNEQLGQIIRLTDENKDGTYETSVVFADGLRWPTAVLWVFNSLLVADAPDLILLQDLDQDGIADSRQVLMTGFGVSNVQQLPNSLQWSLEQRILGASGGNGGQLRPAPEWLAGTQPSSQAFHPPAAESANRISLRGNDFSIDPLTWKFSPETGGTQFGMTTDRWGTRLLCSNSNHCQQVMLDSGVASRNPRQRLPAVRTSIAADGPAAAVFRISPVEPWRIVRTRLRVQGLVPGPIEGGGRAAGYFTSATGLTCYLGDQLPAAYLNNLFVGDVGSNLVHRKQLSGSGVPYTARRTETDTEFLRSSDTWFRPVQMANAPDGTLWILDMYRETIEHPASLPPFIKQHLDLNSGNRRGRIYRVRSASNPLLPRVMPGDVGPEEWIEMLGHTNGWHRTTAGRLLMEALVLAKANERDALLTRIREQAFASPMADARIAAIYLVARWQSLTQPQLERLLGDPHPQVRRHALLAAGRQANPQQLPLLLPLVNDPDPQVRFQLALALGNFPAGTGEAIVALAIQEGENPWMEAALASAVHQDVAGALVSLTEQLPSDPANLAPVLPLILNLADQLTHKTTAEDVKGMAKALESLNDRPLLAGELLSAWKRLPESAQSELNRQLKLAGADWSARVDRIVSLAEQRSANEDLLLEERQRAIGLLSLDPMGPAADRLNELLSPQQPPGIAAAAIRMTGSVRNPQLARALIDALPSLAPSNRAAALQVLLSRTSWSQELVNSLEQQTTPTALISASDRQRLVRHPEASIRQRAQKLLADPQGGDRREVLERYRREISLDRADGQQGQKLFVKHCASCHRLENQGTEIGPNLAAFANRGAESLWLNILDPNREIDPQYLTYQVVLYDGRLLSGMLASESANSITLRDAAGRAETLRRDEIETMRSTSVSLMPSNLEQDLNPTQMSDLIHYLLQQAQ